MDNNKNLYAQKYLFYNIYLIFFILNINILIKTFFFFFFFFLLWIDIMLKIKRAVFLVDSTNFQTINHVF